jgi:aspartyl-tRNA(Asn)/glutamyl-tRNA(Gln) amidotransferase subunit A
MELLKSDFSQIISAIKSKKISCKEIAQFFFNRAKTLDKQLNTVITFNEDLINQAQKMDQEISKGNDPGILTGLPFGIKDMLCTKGIRTTAGSKMLANFIPPYDSTVVSRLKQSGALILGKLNQDEFAMGSSNETSAFGISKNPWNTQCVPGGSSGGSAAAQAARLVVGTIGTDTGGSIRQPSSFCGVVGIKPTYGRVSRYGVIAYASSLDQAGPIVTSVSDAALVLESICGHDQLDSTTAQKPVPQFSKNLKEGFKGLRIGILKEYASGAVDKDVQKVYEEALNTAKLNGAQIKELSVPLTKFAVPIYYLVAASEAAITT